MNISTVCCENNDTQLCFLIKKNKSDKAGPRHNYTKLYFPLFSPVRLNALRIFELGLGSTNQKIKSNMGPSGTPCASLYAWREFFPNAEIYGADIDPLLIRTEERLKTYYCDQLNRVSIQNLWNQPELIQPFDILIEDGIHTLDGSVLFFEESIDHLALGGVYIIEDIHIQYLDKLKSKINEWQDKYTHLNFKLMEQSIPQNTVDNTLLLIQRIK